MAARVLGMHRRLDERRPARLGDGGVVAVDVAVADRRDRPPELVVVLGLEDADQRVVHRLRHRRVQPGVLRHVATRRLRHRLHHAVVDRRQRVFPEARDLGLLGAAPAAGARAHRADLVVLGGPGAAGEGGRRGGPELGRARHQPGLALPPLRNGRRRRRHVGAGGRVRTVASPVWRRHRRCARRGPRPRPARRPRRPPSSPARRRGGRAPPGTPPRRRPAAPASAGMSVARCAAAMAASTAVAVDGSAARRPPGWRVAAAVAAS